MVHEHYNQRQNNRNEHYNNEMSYHIVCVIFLSLCGAVSGAFPELYEYSSALLATIIDFVPSKDNPFCVPLYLPGSASRQLAVVSTGSRVTTVFASDDSSSNADSSLLLPLGLRRGPVCFGEEDDTTCVEDEYRVTDIASQGVLGLSLSQAVQYSDHPLLGEEAEVRRLLHVL